MAIIDKAKQLGLDVGDGTTSLDNLRTIASQVGFDDFNSSSDSNALESVLDEQLANNNTPTSEDGIEMLDGENSAPARQKFGEKEYNAAKKDGKFDKDYYKKREEELAKKTEEAKAERDKNYKMKKGEEGKPIKSDGSNTKRKTKMDRIMDNVNVLKGKKAELDNKIAAGKANARRALNAVEDPLGTAAGAAKDKIKEHTTDKIKEKTDAAKKAVKDKTKKVAAKAASKIGAFIAANPWILLVIAGIIIVVFIILIILSSGGDYGEFKEDCDFNLSTVELTTCNSEDVENVSLKDYVLGVTNNLISGGNYSDDAIKAIMIIVKTNAMAYGGYSSLSKVLRLDTCDYSYSKVSGADEERLKNLYSDIENYLYLSRGYNDVIFDLSGRNSLALDDSILSRINNMSGETLENILDSIYNVASIEDDESNNIFVGDSRIHGMVQSGAISEENAVYADGEGYNWFVNSGVNRVDSILSDGKKHNIYLWLGINDFSTLYTSKYIELAKGKWKNHKIYVMEVGPVDEEKSSISNEVIDSFNKELSQEINGARLSNLKYVSISYNISSFDSSGIHYSNIDYNNIHDKMFGKSNSTSGYGLYNLASYCEFVQTKYYNKSNSLCGTSSEDANLITFLSTWEGHTDYCDGGNGYLAQDIGDGVVSVGPGVTNALLRMESIGNYIDSNGYSKYFTKSGNGYIANLGDCIPVSVVDNIKVYSLESIYATPIDNAAEKYGVSLTQYQRDALTSFNYNLGPGYIDSLIRAYADGGYEGLWSVMKNYYKSNSTAFDKGLKNRRKSEFALFVTGDYTDQGIWSNRSLENYDDYNSEGVMEREMACSMGEFGLPLNENNGFICTSPYGYRVHPITGEVQKFHAGLDIGGMPAGSPIYATKDGVVTKTINDVSCQGSGCSPSSGNMVKIEHTDGTSSGYFHMLKGSVRVSVGDEVKRGDVIGGVGSTGMSTGNHLHFEIYDQSGATLDPYEYLNLWFLDDAGRAKCHN